MLEKYLNRASFRRYFTKVNFFLILTFPKALIKVSMILLQFISNYFQSFSFRFYSSTRNYLLKTHTFTRENIIVFSLFFNCNGEIRCFLPEYSIQYSTHFMLKTSLRIFVIAPATDAVVFPNNQVCNTI